MNGYTNKLRESPLPPRLSRRRLLAGIAGFAGAALVAGCDVQGQTSSQGTATPTVSATRMASPAVTGEAVVPPGGTLLVYREQVSPLHDVAWSPEGNSIASACGSLTISPPKEDK